MATANPSNAVPNIETTSGRSTPRQFVTISGKEGATGKKAPTGNLTIFIHLVKGFVGTGIFAMGEALKFSGHVFGLLLLVLLALMNLNCQHMLLRTANKVAEEEENEVKPSFSETVEYTMELSSIKWLQKHSQKFGVATTTLIVMAELGFCCVYLVFIAEHLVEISADFGFLKIKDVTSVRIMLAIILLPMWASTFLGNLKLLMPISAIANFVMWTGVILIVYFTLEGGVTPDGERKFITDLSQIYRFFGITLFSFEGITFVIPLRNEMKEPEKFTKPLGILNFGMAFVAFLYGLIGFLAYWKYGEETESSVFLNLPHGQILTYATEGLMCLGIIFTYTLHMYIPFEVSYPLFHRKYGPFKHNFIVMTLYRSVPVLITYILANVVPKLGLFIALVGCTTGAILALLIPPVLQLIAFKGELGIVTIIKDWIIILIALTGLVGGTILSIKDIIEAFIDDAKHNSTNTTGH